MHIVCYKINVIKLTSINGITLTSTIEITYWCQINGITLHDINNWNYLDVNKRNYTDINKGNYLDVNKRNYTDINEGNYLELPDSHSKHVSCIEKTLLINTCSINQYMSHFILLVHISLHTPNGLPPKFVRFAYCRRHHHCTNSAYFQVSSLAQCSA